MTSLVEAQLNFARLDRETISLKKEPIKLSELINQYIENKRNDNDNVNLTFNCSAEHVSTLAARNYLKMVLITVKQGKILR